jgi:uncharacterized damage-inducible protein DinB
MENNTSSTATATIPAISAAQLLQTWQGHRALSRRTIVEFPAEHFNTFSIGGMRTYAQLASEMITMATGTINGVATRTWKVLDSWKALESKKEQLTKEEILTIWDEVTAEIEALWPEITAARFQETDSAFGMYEGTVYSLLLYTIDNEIHHRGQGYVYFRALGIAPPPFWERQ